MDRVKDVWMKYWQIILTITIVTIIGLGFISNRGQEKEEELSSVLAVNELEEAALGEVEERVESEVVEDTWIMVDIKGHVKYPGVYELLLNSRVQDVIELAGGLTEDANPLTINLAQKLTDEMVLYVGGPEDEMVNPTNQVDSQDTGSHLIVNINEATKEELMQLNSIGAVKAENIIQYREEHGGFKTIEELKNVSGIGDKTFENLKENLSI